MFIISKKLKVPVLELQIGIFFKNVNYRLIVGADEHGLKQDTKYKDI